MKNKNVRSQTKDRACTINDYHSVSGLTWPIAGLGAASRPGDEKTRRGEVTVVSFSEVVSGGDDDVVLNTLKFRGYEERSL